MVEKHGSGKITGEGVLTTKTKPPKKRKIYAERVEKYQIS